MLGDMKITKASLFLEIDNKICFAVLEGVDLDLMVQMIAGLTEKGKLLTVKMGDDFKMVNLKEVLGQK
jgi:hypothetical protein